MKKITIIGTILCTSVVVLASLAIATRKVSSIRAKASDEKITLLFTASDIDTDLIDQEDYDESHFTEFLISSRSPSNYEYVLDIYSYGDTKSNAKINNNVLEIVDVATNEGGYFSTTFEFNGSSYQKVVLHGEFKYRNEESSTDHITYNANGADSIIINETYLDYATISYIELEYYC